MRDIRLIFVSASGDLIKGEVKRLFEHVAKLFTVLSASAYAGKKKNLVSLHIIAGEFQERNKFIL